MLGYDCGYVAGQFPKFMDEVYWIENPTSSEKKFMLPTAETALVNLHRGEILDMAELPRKYIAYTPCYRCLLYTSIDSDLPYDVLVYTREEWDRLAEDSASFAARIRRTGRVLYASDTAHE